jgi:hypothetical protein
MHKEYFDSLRPIQQAEVSYIVDKAIDEMVQEQFDLARMLAFIELAKERLGQLDVVPRSLVNERNGVGGSTCASLPSEDEIKDRQLVCAESSE